MERTPALELTDLSVAYRDSLALNQASLTVPEGVSLALLGPNGAGKSTLMKAALGLVPTLGGRALFFGSPLARVRRRVGYMPQAAEVDWDYPATVGDVVAQASLARRSWLARPRTEDRRRVQDALAAVGLTDLADRHIAELSGGQKQRTFMARILAHDPDLFFMDEPFAGVDAATERTLFSVLEMLVEAGKTLVIVHHDLSSVTSICQWACLMSAGRVISSGPLSQAFTTETVHEAYGISDALFSAQRDRS